VQIGIPLVARRSNKSSKEVFDLVMEQQQFRQATVDTEGFRSDLDRAVGERHGVDTDAAGLRSRRGCEQFAGAGAFQDDVLDAEVEALRSGMS
jgi:hypothetical protein